MAALRDHDTVVNDGVTELWATTGGGELFESENIVLPLGSDNAFDRTEALQAVIPRGALVFHEGMWISIGDRRTIAAVDGHGRVIAEFESIDGWYDALRDEFGARYGLE